MSRGVAQSLGELVHIVDQMHWHRRRGRQLLLAKVRMLIGRIGIFSVWMFISLKIYQLVNQSVSHFIYMDQMDGDLNGCVNIIFMDCKAWG